jgi:hypothetical protein
MQRKLDVEYKISLSSSKNKIQETQLQNPHNESSFSEVLVLLYFLYITEMLI